LPGHPISYSLYGELAGAGLRSFVWRVRGVALTFYRDKVALVTGGASGIGAELARQLVAAGAAVVIADVAIETAHAFAGELRQRGGRVVACQANVARFEDVERAVQTAVADFGRLDLMFNNAGIGLAGEIRDLQLSDWRPVLEVNLWGVIHGIHAALPIMLRQGQGQIVNIASAAGLVPRPGMVPYATSKFAVVGLSTSLRYEVEDLGVRVNVVCPFLVATGIFKSTTFRNVDGAKMLAEVPIGQLPVKQCVEEILRGVQKNRAIISLPRFARFEWRLYRYCPWAASLIWRRRRALLRKHRIKP
jgi:NAD(P)-dependent dehydrogenase (short-subunit alcohol dehydrogenase family)